MAKPQNQVPAPARTVEEHLAAIAALPLPEAGPVEVCSPLDGVGRVLAENACAAVAVPPFDNSAMDGFLLLGNSTGTFPVSGQVRAGVAPQPLSPGTAVRIMTGAPVGTDDPTARVIPVEDTDAQAGPGPLPTSVTVDRLNPDKRHIRRAGENLDVGDLVVAAGTRVGAGEVAALISAGVSSIRVHPLPHVAVVSTGDELVDAGQALHPGQIPDSNQPMLAALLLELGVPATTVVHGPDEEPALRKLLKGLAESHDLILTTGGVSVGAFDVVRAVYEPAGVWFGEVAQKPGAPQGLGTYGGTPVLAFPGNPVAAFVSAHLYLPPLLGRLQRQAAPPGLNSRPRVFAQGKGFRAARERTLFVPVRLDWNTSPPTATAFSSYGAGSHFVGALSSIDGLALIPPRDCASAAENGRFTVLLI